MRDPDGWLPIYERLSETHGIYSIKCKLYNKRCVILDMRNYIKLITK